MGRNKVDDTINTYNSIAENYSNRAKNLQVNILEKLAFFSDYLIKRKARRVLDVGCGAGWDSKYLSEKGFKVFGIDMSENLLKIAEKNAPLVRFSKMDMRYLNFGDEYFDGLWVCASLLHVPRSEGLDCIAGFGRVLSKEGLLYITVKEGEGEEVVANEKSNNLPRLFSFYKEDELCKLVKENDFTVLKSSCELSNGTNWIHLFAVKK